MSASVHEQILARVASLLSADGATSAGANVDRERDDAYGETITKAIDIRRQPGSEDKIADTAQRLRVAFDLDLYAAGGAAPLTDADALHMEAHALLMGDSTLASLGKGLRCIGTEPQTDSTDRLSVRLTAHYEMQVLCRPGDLTRSIT